jgi:hypothetical protein
MKTLKIAAGLVLIAALAVSCIPEQQSMGDAGQTLVKLSPAGYAMLAVDAKTTAQTGILFEVRRDIPSQAALNTTTSVVLSYDTDGKILAAYNTAHKTTYIPLPTTLATTVPAISAGQLTLDFAAGEFAKSVILNIPSSASFDFSKNYALAFKLSSVSGSGTIGAAGGTDIVCEVLAKNKWDGIYTVTGTFVDYVYDAGGTTYAAIYPKVIQLKTTGALTCQRYDADYASNGYVFDSGGATSFGNWYPYFKFDANDNVVDCINSFVDPPARSRTALLYTGAGSINKYNAATKTMDVTFQMKQMTVTPNVRNLITEHYVYKGPR